MAGDPLDRPVKRVSVFVPIIWLLAVSSIFLSRSWPEGLAVKIV
jgi:hypothetical protein